MALSRSQQMARIRGRDTKPEVILRKALWARGLRYRVNYKTPAGRADVAMPGKRVAVFVDGCFWHGCPDHFTTPNANREWWVEKIDANRRRDDDSMTRLRSAGWRPIVVWEHESAEEAADRIEEAVRHS